MKILIVDTRQFLVDIKAIPETETKVSLSCHIIESYSQKSFERICEGIAALPREVTTLSFRGIWLYRLSNEHFCKLMQAVPPHVQVIDLAATALNLRQMANLSFEGLRYLSHAKVVNLQANNLMDCHYVLPNILRFLGRKKSIDLRGNNLGTAVIAASPEYINALAETSRETEILLEEGPVTARIEAITHVRNRAAMAALLLGTNPRLAGTSAFFRAFGLNPDGQTKVNEIAEHRLLGSIKQLM